MNKVIMMGRLTRDPEVRYGGANNNAVARYSLAVDRRFKRDGEPDADFFNCVAFGKTAEFIGEYFRKGRKILLKGSLQMNQYESEGKKLTTYVVIAENVEFGEAKANTNAGGNDYKAPSNAVMETSNFEEFHSGADNIENTSIADDEFPF